MIESEFKKLAEKEKCEYKVKNFVVDGSIGSKLPISIYTINLLYTDIVLEIKFELGNSNIAESKFQIIASKNLPNFELVTRSHFSRLFFKSEQIWEIVCYDSEFKKVILNFLNVSGLNEIAKKEAFEPIIEGNYKNGIYSFSIKYYLGFNEKEKSLFPIVEFQKKIIDFLIGSEKK